MQSEKLRCFYLQRLHPVNWPIAVILSVFCRVFYWRRDAIPLSMTSRFEVLDPGSAFDLENWQDAGEQAYEHWRTAAHSGRSALQAGARVAGHRVDYSANWQQWVASAIEERFIFFRLLERLSPRESSGHRTIAGATIDSVSRTLGITLEPPTRFRFADGFAWFDELWAGLRLIAMVFRRFLALFRNRPAPPAQPIPILWTGISPSEMASEDGQLDFSFVVPDALMGPQACLYVLPAEPAPAVRKRLAVRRVNWITYQRLGFLPVRVKVIAVAALVRCLFHAVTFGFGSPRRLFEATSVCVSLPAICVARYFDTRTYVASLSACWPEGAEVAALNAMGVQSVNWSYGANTFLYSSENGRFRDVGVPRSVAVASEIWVWSNEVKDWLEARLVGSKPKVVTTGPVMCGDSSWCALSPAQARARFGTNSNGSQLFVALFDVPPLSQKARLAVGHGPTNYPLEMLEGFFSDCERLLDDFSDVVLVVKPKRALQDSNREFGAAMQRILDPQSALSRAGRILVVPHDLDPYVAIAIAEVSVGIPFTSPVLAARASGRVGLFHDPLNQVRHFRPTAYNSFMSHGYDELAGRIAAVRHESPAYGWSNGDPVIRFCELLQMRKT
jgi:hypothetical protein